MKIFFLTLGVVLLCVGFLGMFFLKPLVYKLFASREKKQIEDILMVFRIVFLVVAFVGAIIALLVK